LLIYQNPLANLEFGQYIEPYLPLEDFGQYIEFMNQIVFPTLAFFSLQEEEEQGLEDLRPTTHSAHMGAHAFEFFEKPTMSTVATVPTMGLWQRWPPIVEDEADHMRSHASSQLHSAAQLQSGAGLEPFPKDVSAEEKIAEARLRARRKRRHGEALSGHVKAARIDELFPSRSMDDALKKPWTADTKVPTKGSVPYEKFVKPAGDLTQDALKDLVSRLGLPLKKDMGLLVEVLYRHHLNSLSVGAPKLPKGSSIYTTLGQFFKGGESGPVLVEKTYKRFKQLMNDPSTYDAGAMAARNRVQAVPGRPESEAFLPVPKTQKTGDLDRRFTAGTYNSTRDQQSRLRYMSVAGGDFGSYQCDLLDMGRRGKPYNKQFWYLLTLLNTNSRYAYACPVKKGADMLRGETAASRTEKANLSDRTGKEIPPQWIQKQIIPAMERIMAMIDSDLHKDTKGELTHRKIKSVMVDAGAEFNIAFRSWLAGKGITTIVCQPETHEEMSRLNAFHRFFRARYNAQWAKYHENPRGYGGIVRWVAVKADKFGFATEPSDEGLQLDGGDEGKEEAEDLFLEEEKEEEGEKDEDGKDQHGEGDENDWGEAYTPEEQKLATETGAWRISYWEDWLHAHNTVKKANSLRGAEVREAKLSNERRTARLAKAPAEITDEMVRNLIRYDAARREVVKQRVDKWISDHSVLTQADLPASDKAHATRVRLDLNRSKYGTEIRLKGTTFLSIWSERHYPLVARVGTNTFQVEHAHESDFPTVWPMYRFRIVTDPSNVAQPSSAEVKVGPGKDEDARAVNLDDRLKTLTARDAKARLAVLENEKNELQEQEQEEDRMMTRAMAVKNYDQTARIKMPPLPLSQGDVLPLPGDVLPMPKKSHKKKLPDAKLPVDRPQKQSDASKKSHKKKVPVAQPKVTAADARVSTRVKKPVEKLGFT